MRRVEEAIAMMLLCACGGSEAPQEGATLHGDAAVDAARTQSNDAANRSSPESTPSDASSELYPIADVSAGEPLTDALRSEMDSGCVELDNIASPIDETTSTDPEPTPAGGAIVDGTYVATRAINYGAADAGYNVMS